MEPINKSPYTVKLEIFEGPLELLLYLIRKNEYDIFDIPISEITEHYLQYLELMRELDLDVAGEFLVMAATLLRIKSRMLLPRPEGDEESDMEPDPRAELVEQLIEYYKFREAAMDLESRAMLGRDVFARKFFSPELKEVEQQYSKLEVNLFELIDALREVLNRAPENTAHIIQAERISIAQKMMQILAFFSGKESVLFADLFASDTDKTEIVISFLSLLEIIRRGFARIHQSEHFGPIWIVPLISGDIEKVEVEGER